MDTRTTEQRTNAARASQRCWLRLYHALEGVKRDQREQRLYVFNQYARQAGVWLKAHAELMAERAGR